MPDNRRVRQRKLPGPTLTGEVKNEHESSFHTVFEIDSSGSQITDSKGNDWPAPKGAGLTDRGSDFYTSKQYAAAMPPQFAILDALWPAAGQTLGYHGHLLGCNSAAVSYVHSDNGYNSYRFNFPPTLELSAEEMDERGATAIARCKPGEPVADVATTIGEIMREGLPSLPGLLSFKRSSPVSRKNASEYLNYQFGVNPLVSSIKDFVHGVSNADKLLKQLIRDSGKVVRRSYSFPLESDLETLEYDPVSGPFGFNAVNQFVRNKYGIPSSAGSYRERHVLRKVWFSGAFTYYVPPEVLEAGLSGKSAEINAILGTEFTPETAWNLAPWSWAVDWFSNTGDVISNLNDFLSQSLVMHYGYLMVHTIVTDTYNYGPLPPFEDGRPNISSVQLVTETKQRRKANPFGFGVSWEGLDPFQLSIIAALGISRR